MLPWHDCFISVTVTFTSNLFSSDEEKPKNSQLLQIITNFLGSKKDADNRLTTRLSVWLPPKNTLPNMRLCRTPSSCLTRHKANSTTVTKW